MNIKFFENFSNKYGTKGIIIVFAIGNAANIIPDAESDMLYCLPSIGNIDWIIE
jgi:hypothetical protein